MDRSETVAALRVLFDALQAGRMSEALDRLAEMPDASVMPDLWLACVQGAVMTARADDDLDLYTGAIEAAERALEILRGPDNAMRVGLIERYAGEAVHALARHDNDVQELRTAIDHYDR